MNPKFSILVPACNMAGKMTECINSILSQTLSDYEVIIVDDGSKDDTWNEISKYEADDKRFHAIKHEENKSLLGARYTGMNAATGDYILFLDSDDYIEADTLESLNGYIEKNPVDVIRFGFRYEPEGRDSLPPETDDPIKFYMSGQMPPAIWKNCYSKKVIDLALERTGSFYCNMGEDVYFAGILFSCANSFGVLDKVLHHYVLGNGMSNSSAGVSIEKINRDMHSVVASGEHLQEFIDKYNPDYSELAKFAIRNMYRFVLVQNIIFEEDYCKILDRIKVFDTPELSKLVYEWACRELLPYKILIDLQRGPLEQYHDIEVPDFYEMMGKE